jgi:thiamine pyrophosphate-dependent acetolactate synthase large subunit-like protein
MTATAVQRVYQVLADQLAELDLGAFFGLMGEDTAALGTQLATTVPYYAARHEAIAVAMADGYSWASGELGLCLTTRGPGLTNALTAARTAARGSRRVLLICGNAPAVVHSPDPKHVDQAAICAAADINYLEAPDAASAPAVLAEAIAAAQAGSATVFAIASDVLNGTAPDDIAYVPAPAPGHASGAASADDLARIVAALDGCARPLILAGRGAIAPDAKAALEALAEKLGALVGTTLAAKGLFHGNPLSLGTVGGFMSGPALAALGQVDCVLTFGASLNTYTTGKRGHFANATVIQIDRDESHFNRYLDVELAVTGDAGLTARHLLELVPEASERPQHDRALLEGLALPQRPESDESGDGTIDPRAVPAILDELLPPGRSVVIDSGGFMAYPARYMTVDAVGAFRFTTDFGSVGQGLGTALGVAVARPQGPVVLFIGDGGMMMSLADLETAARYGLPIVVVVMNDHAFGAEKIVLDRLGVPKDQVIFPDTDFATVASALGLTGHTVRGAEELRALAPSLAEPGGPVLLDCKLYTELDASWIGG